VGVKAATAVVASQRGREWIREARLGPAIALSGRCSPYRWWPSGRRPL